jgi:hypothetical protein
MNIFISSFNVSGESSRDPTTRIRLVMNAGSLGSFGRSEAFERALRFRRALTTALSHRSRRLLPAGHLLLGLVGRHRPSMPFASGPGERAAWTELGVAIGAAIAWARSERTSNG